MSMLATALGLAPKPNADAKAPAQNITRHRLADSSSKARPEDVDARVIEILLMRGPLPISTIIEIGGFEQHHVKASIARLKTAGKVSQAGTMLVRSRRVPTYRLEVK